MAAVVMSLTQWCFRPKVGDGFWISAIEFRCWGNLWFVYFWSDLCDHDRLTSVSQICHQHIWSPTCVTNIDVGLLTPHLVQYKIWKGFAMRIVQNNWLQIHFYRQPLIAKNTVQLGKYGFKALVIQFLYFACLVRLGKKIYPN